MNTEIIELSVLGNTERHVVITYDNGSIESFAINENNPRYQQWLAEGNTPEVIND